MGLRRSPYVFTEQGVVMLSSVLRSERAIQVNIEIMRVFVQGMKKFDAQSGGALPIYCGQNHPL